LRNVVSSSVEGTAAISPRSPSVGIEASESAPWRDRVVGLRRTRADAYRVYAILLIICAHCEASIGLIADSLLHLSVNVVGQATIPFFFFIAGNHLGPKIARHPDAHSSRAYVSRIGRLFLVWSAVYFVHGALASERHPDLWGLWLRHARRLLADPVALVLHGTSLHLWFLVALMFAALFCVVMLGRGRLRLLMGTAAALYAAALMVGPYGEGLGLLQSDWRGLSGILQAPVFFALGIVLSHARTRSSASTGWALVALGIALQGAETIALSRTGLNPFELGMLVGAVPLATGIGVLALQPDASPLDRVAARFAVLVPVAYLSHVIFLDLLRPQRHAFDQATFRVIFPVAVTLLAFGTAALLRRAGRRGHVVSRVLLGGRTRTALP
jgi:surface polysaccharide O-acyltransferase-like enzyme